MWNPKSYRDTDFGLAKDESFEPDEQDADNMEPGPGEPYIQTVLGRIDPDDAGVTLVHEHVYMDLGVNDPDQALTNTDAALVDLETFFTVGGRTVVDATIPARGRSATALVWLAQRGPVHLIASTGVCLSDDADEYSIRSALEREISIGFDGTSIRPGMMIVSVNGVPDRAHFRSVFETIAGVVHASPVPLLIDMTDLEAGVIADIIDTGIPSRGIIVGNMAQLENERTVADIAELGTFLLFDGLGMRRSDSDRITASRVAELLLHGRQDRILLSHGYTRRSQLTGYEGKPGLAYIVEQFAIMLMEAGVAAHDVRTMLVENCASALTIFPQEPQPISTS